MTVARTAYSAVTCEVLSSHKNRLGLRSWKRHTSSPSEHLARALAQAAQPDHECLNIVAVDTMPIGQTGDGHQDPK